MEFSLTKRIRRLKKSLSRRFAEARLPRGYQRLGTRYGGWWIDTNVLGKDPLVIDCGLGEDISFPTVFLKKFGGKVVGIETNPKSIRYCVDHLPSNMVLIHKAFWIQAGETIEFFLPRSPAMVSGSLLPAHAYAGTEKISLQTTNLEEILQSLERNECDILKMDIEGAEYEVLKGLCISGEIRKVKQLLVEYHHFCTSYSEEDTLESIRAVADRGFQLVHVEDRDYIFRRL
jgi:FkbM family methyltransferase